MKKNTSFKRNKIKPHKKNGLNGFENKIYKQRPKGNPLEIRTKYETLAKDASSAEVTTLRENARTKTSRREKAKAKG